MSNWRFIFVSAGIFLAEYLLSFFWPFLLRAELFIIFALAVFFLDSMRKINFAIIFAAAVFFDFWSSSTFGNLTLILFLTILFIFLIKRVMLVDNRPNFSALLWLTGFYYFYLFTKGILYNFGGPYIFPNLSIINLIETVSWVSAMLIIYKIASHEKKIPRF